MLMPLRFREAFPVFTSMMAEGWLLVPTACGVAKFVRPGNGVRKGPFTPAPLRGMASGLILVLSVIVMAPDRAPAVVGMKFTVMEQCAPGARLAPQSLVWLKFPLATILAMLILTLLGLLINVVRGKLVVATP